MLIRLEEFLKKRISAESYDRLREWYRAHLKGKIPFCRWIRKFLKYMVFSHRFPRVYRRCSRKEIDENKVLFIEPTNLFSNNFEYLYQILRTDYDFDIHIHLLRNFFVKKREYYRRCVAMLKDAATAKYLFIDEACNVFAEVPLRPETVIAQTWHACGAFKKFGFSTAESLFGADRETMERYPYYQHNTFVTVSSPEVVWAYAEAMGLPEEKILPIGVSRTDVFFDDAFRENARQTLLKRMPSAAGKKVILFAPTFRGRIAKATTATAFSVSTFYEALAEEYVLLIKHHPHVKERPAVPEEYAAFARDVTEEMTIEELLCVADLCISDYSSVVFEYSLFEKPMLFFNYDMEEYCDWRGFYYDYDTLTPGPSFQTNEDMVDYIRHIDERFDRQQVVDFKEKFMRSCDGHSTERLMDRVFGEALEMHTIREKNN